MKNARHKARELALQGLYQWLLAEEHAEEIRTHLAEFKGYDKADQAYLVEGFTKLRSIFLLEGILVLIGLAFLAAVCVFLLLQSVPAAR